MANLQYQKLPNEILFIIIEFGVLNSTAVHAPHHTATRTLVSWSQVCRSTHKIASRLLYQHCLYIDSTRCLLALSYSIKARGIEPCSNKVPQNSRCFCWKYILNSDGTFHHSGAPRRIFLNLTLTSATSPSTSGTNELPSLGEISRIGDDTSSSHSNEAISMAVRDLFLAASPALQHLVAIIQLDALNLEDKNGCVRSLLHEGFSYLTSLEEFTTIRDKLYTPPKGLSDEKMPTWEAWWPKLQRLRLYHPNMRFRIDPNE